MLLTILVLISFLLAPAVFALTRTRFASAAALLPATLFVTLSSLLPGVLAGTPVTESHRWVPSLGIDLAFRADGLSLLFALLITGIGSCIFLYAATYLKKYPDRSKLFLHLTLFMGAMLGAVLADNLVLMLVFWELTSITSFLLIGYEHEKLQARLSAQQGFLVTVGGGLALTAGIILLGNAAGTFQMGELVAQGTPLANQPWAAAIIVLIALGAFTKSAQTPFHFWLPNAMVAPTPVSAYLHSATMVKLGIYLLARLDPVFGNHDLWIQLLTGAGLLTMLTSGVLMLRETDLKKILAYSTLAALGTLTLLVGSPHEIAAVAMATFLIVHALYKACLFMVAGAIDHEAGTRDSSLLSGLRRSMPFTAGIAAVAGLSMAGLPPLLGFIGKELVYEASLAASAVWLITGVALFVNAATVVAAGIVSLRCFWGQQASTPKKSHDPPWGMLLGPAVLAGLGVVFGMAPWLVEGLVGKVAESLTGEQVSVHLLLWHGFTEMLMLSLVTVALGGVTLLLWNPLRRWLAGCQFIDKYGPSAAYNNGLEGMIRFANWQTQTIQNGSLHTYLAVTFFVIACPVLLGLIGFGGIAFPTISSAALNPVAILSVLLIISSVAVVRAGNFMAGIVAAGLVGFLMALVYLFQGAPDLAFTQFSIEALSVVVILIIVGRMPMHTVDVRTLTQRRRDLVLAIGFGVVVTLTMLAITSLPFDDRLSRYYQAVSVPEAHGHNVVNVIIVDFRGLDTMGEMTVLALAAISASSLLFKFSRRRRRANKTREVES